MKIDEDRIDKAVPALLYWPLDRGGSRLEEIFQWNAMNRLHAKGMIGDPLGKAKSLVLTDEGIVRSERLFREMFTKQDR